MLKKIEENLYKQWIHFYSIWLAVKATELSYRVIYDALIFD